MTESYIINKYPVEIEQYEYVASLTEGLHPDTHKLFSHLLLSNIFEFQKTWNWEENWSPVPWQTIHKQLRDAKWKELLEKGLIEASGYSKDQGLCREYKVRKDVLEGFLAGSPKAYDKKLVKRKVDLMTGKKTTYVFKSSKFDGNENAYPDVIAGAIKTIDECIVNLPALQQHVTRLEEQINLYPVGSRDYDKAKGIYYNDLACFKTILYQNLEPIGNGLFKYRPAYRVQMSGRLTEIGGGMQSCSREMKVVGFSDIPDLHNYDIKSSQPIGLIQQFQQAGLDTGWLERYKDSDKKQYADTVGISVDTWKICLCAIMMGAYLPVSVKKSEGSVIEALTKELTDYEAVETAFFKLLDVVAPLKAELDKWHDWILDVYVPNNRTNSSGKCYIQNPTGLTICVDDLPKAPHMRKSILAAFILQGQEAAFIHNLTELANEFNFKVLSNQHDGLITVGEIPQEAIQSALLRSGAHNLSLVQKPFL